MPRAGAGFRATIGSCGRGTRRAVGGRRALTARVVALAGLSLLSAACGGAASASPGSAGLPPVQPASPPATSAPAGSETPPALAPGASRILTYCNGQQLLVTLPHRSGLRPAVVFVHGGDWIGGNYSDQGYVQSLRPALNKAGFVVAGVDYRLAPANKWPAQIQDVSCAVRYLRAWATRLHVDPRRIVGWGDSAGGQLVSLMATAPTLGGPDYAGPYGAQSDALEGVIDMYGLVDLPAELDYLLGRKNGSFYAQLEIHDIFGDLPPARIRPVLRAASAVTYVRAGDPPFLVLQGTADTVCPESQSLTLAAELRSVHTPVRLILVKGGQHGLTTPGEQPDEAQLIPVIVAWATRYFHPSQAGAGVPSGSEGSGAP